MKQYKKIIFIFLVGAYGLSACKKNLLDLKPKEGFAEETFFQSASDLKTYANAFYDNGIFLRNLSGTASRTVGFDVGTDDVVGLGPSAGINTRSVTTPPISIGWSGQYNFIRTINIFLKNAYRVPRDVLSKQYTGEGYFARASSYFSLLVNYGGVPLITEPLAATSPDLYKPRMRRDSIAMFIIKDLDSAIANLQLKASAGAGRVNKQAALHFKTRVGLFEGSWEYYHAGTPFGVEGKNGNEFLDAAVKAGDDLIAIQGIQVYAGSLLDLFKEKNAATVSEAFFYRAFDFTGGLTANFFSDGHGGLGLSMTRQFVDEVLMKDGKPASISTVVNDETSLRALGQNKDPRLSQTIWTRPVDGTGKSITFWDYFGGVAAPPANIPSAYKSSYPGLITSQQRLPISTGYRIMKGVPTDYTENATGGGNTDDIIFRYSEALLNYAEAKAILGTITQADLDKTVNLLRKRPTVNMPTMNLAEINGWAVTYEAKFGYKPGASNILNEIRRERRVELATEGFRRNDLRRWAVLGDVVNGFKPMGAHAKEFIDYWNKNNTLLVQDGFVPTPATAPYNLTAGTNYGLDVTGKYFNPFFNSADFGNAGAGGFINTARDYLEGIGTEEIQLYMDKGGVVLTQNPGWQ